MYIHVDMVIAYKHWGCIYLRTHNSPILHWFSIFCHGLILPHCCYYESLCFLIGFDINKVLTSGWTALMYACDYGVNDVIKLLLESGADSKTEIGKPGIFCV